MRTLAAATILAVAALTAQAADVTHLEDETGVLQLDAPGTWRPLGGKFAFAASGFVGGIKRTELFATIYADTKDADGAAKKWKDARTAETPGAEFTNPDGDPSRWIVVEPAKKSLDYCRSLAGAGMSAVVWARMNGEPGAADADAFALLGEAKFVKAVASGAEAAAPPDMQTVKDRDFAFELTVPKAMVVEKDVDPPRARLTLRLKGPVGADPEAYLEVYSLPDFDRADAAGWWWIEAERRGWAKSGVKIEGEPPAFLVLPNGETWSRHVRILPTKAGFCAVKLDVESAADKAGDALLDQLVEGRSLKVLRPRPDTPATPPGSTRLDRDPYVLFHEIDAEGADALAKEAAFVDATVGRVLGLDALDGQKGTLRVLKDQISLDAALRPLGGAAGRAAFWSIATREIVCRAGVLAADATRAEFQLELAREAVRRRFGFRPPFWVEYGVANLVEGAAFNKGRIDQLNPLLSESAHNSVGVNIEFETVRWWTEADSVGNPERQAIVWGLWLLFTEGGNVTQKWADPLKQYVAKLRQTGRPAEATKVFSFDRDADVVDDYKKRMKKLDR